MQWGAALIISDRSPTHCVDESPAGYSWAGCSPAEPACASPAGDHHAKTGSHGETKNRTTGKSKTTTVKDVSGQCVKDVSGLDMIFLFARDGVEVPVLERSAFK